MTTDFPKNRPETGPMQFGNDWRGLYIRGDNAMGFIQDLQMILLVDGEKLSPHSKKCIEGLVNELSRSNHHSKDQVQMMKPFSEAFLKDEDHF